MCHAFAKVTSVFFNRTLTPRFRDANACRIGDGAFAGSLPGGGTRDHTCDDQGARCEAAQNTRARRDPLRRSGDREGIARTKPRSHVVQPRKEPARIVSRPRAAARKPFSEIKPGLAALEGTRTWDVVIDIPAYYPRLVEATARLLAPRAAHYIVMSSISAYADFKSVGLHEESPVRPVAESFEQKEDLTMGDWPTYGGRKAACERTAARVFDGRFAAVRAHSIIGGMKGAGDNTPYLSGGAPPRRGD